MRNSRGGGTGTFYFKGGAQTTQNLLARRGVVGNIIPLHNSPGGSVINSTSTLGIGAIIILQFRLPRLNWRPIITRTTGRRTGTLLTSRRLLRLSIMLPHLSISFLRLSIRLLLPRIRKPQSKLSPSLGEIRLLDESTVSNIWVATFSAVPSVCTVESGTTLTKGAEGSSDAPSPVACGGDNGASKIEKSLS
ncbi:hypothetical protein HanRHA438_Chr06g0274761 [Helianthus annuus]|nr:hypothetical protein HanRHA438_Chr06g0274761 [Helianthus annuus]